MKIAINLIPFKNVSGIEIFTKNIIDEFLKLSDDNIKFYILGSENLPNVLNFQKREDRVEVIKINGLRKKYSKALYQQFSIYGLLKKYKIDLLFSPSLAGPFFYKNKIMVIHDCAYDRFNEEFENILSKIYIRMMFYGAKYFSKKIVTVSNFSKRELIEFYKIKPEKIEVIYEGVPEMPEVEENFIQEILTKFKIVQPYFLYIGNWRPRKNLQGLIKAFKIFTEKNKNFQLVIAGKKDKRFFDLEEIIKDENLGQKVILTDFISQEEKTALYKKAVALTFPSYYEGFGLPVLEAQSLEVPVLTSNTSSLLEVGRDSVLYVNPYNIKEIARGMEKIAFNETFKKELIKKGFENIKRFSWQKSARETLEVLKEAYENYSDK